MLPLDEYTEDDYLLIVLGLVGGDVKQPSFQLIRKLNDEERDDFLSSSSEIAKWLKSDNDTFEFVEFSYNTFVSTVENIKKQFLCIPTPNVDDSLLAINAAILNLLSSMRLYLDHTKTRLSRCDKSELSEHQEATHMEFDNVFAYRFFDKLRNFAQHCGMPITVLSASSNLEQQTGGTNFTFELNFDRDFLLKEFHEWKHPVTEELRALDTQFDVLKLVDDVIASFRALREKTILIYIRRLEPNITFLKSLLNETAQFQGTPLVIRKKEDIQVAGGRQAQIEMKYFPTKLLDICNFFTS